VIRDLWVLPLRRVRRIWRAMGDSNARPLAPEANALSN
jgi:hypothetical protein